MLCYKPFDYDKLRIQLSYDEGVVYSIYLDSEDLPTFGIGHLILPSDSEFGLPVGTSIHKDRVLEAYEKDTANLVYECKLVFTGWKQYPEEAQQVFANMMFNLGRPRLSKFENTIAAAEACKWKKAAEEALDSKWATQVGPRATRLAARLREI